MVYEVMEATEQARLSAPTADTSTGVAPLSILLTDDNAIIRKLLTSLLIKRGHNVVVANDHEQAICALEIEEFDLVLIEMRNSERDGLRTVSAIREARKTNQRRLSIIALIAKATMEDAETCLSAGFDSYLTKPVQAEMLWRVIEDHANAARRGMSRTQSNRVMDRRAALARVNNDLIFLAEMTTLFLKDECPRLLVEIQTAIRQDQATQLASAAHTLKNWIGNFAAPQVFEAVRVVEEMGRLKDLRGAEQANEVLRREIDRLTPELVGLASGSDTLSDPGVVIIFNNATGSQPCTP